MNEHFWEEAGQEKLVQFPCEAEACPVMSVFENIKSIALEFNLSVEVLLVESRNWDLALAMILNTVMFAVEVQVMLHWATRIFGLLILTGRG